MTELKLVFPEEAWRDFHQKTRIAQARQKLYDDRVFWGMWMSSDPGRAGPMCDRAIELGMDPELARLAVKDITGHEPDIAG